MAYKRIHDSPDVIRLSDGRRIPSVVDEVLAFVEAGGVIDDADPPPSQRVITPRQFRERFTPTEQRAMYLASREDTPEGETAYILLMQVAEAQEVDLDHPDVVNGVAFWVYMGVVTEERAAEVLA